MTLTLPALLRDAFPTVREDEWPDECMVRAALAGKSDDRWDHAIAVVSTHGQAEALASEIQRRHRSPRGGTTGSCNLDGQFADVMTECEALAWAATVGKLSPVRITANVDGVPDITVEGWGWVEAKSIHSSDDDRAMLAAMRTAGRTSGIGQPSALTDEFFNKVDYHLGKALKQWNAVGGPSAGHFAIFIDVLQFDIGVFVTPEDWRRLERLVRATAKENHCRIAVALNFNWRAPRIDTSR